MAYAEKRGKGPRPWRVKYKVPGGEASQSGFETKQAALGWGRDQEAKVRAGTWTDPGAGEITVSEWIDRWKALHDVGPSTTANREYRIRRFIRPYWGKRTLNSLTGEEIAGWERTLPAAEGISRSTAKDARSLLHTILGDAAAARPPLIPFNPAVRPRNRGRRTGRGLDRSPQRAWATPLEVLLVAERAALLAGRDDEFTMLVTIGYTGMRWGETIGLERDLLLPSLINVEWQLREVSGRFHRLPPKDDSYRSTNVEPLTPGRHPALPRRAAGRPGRQARTAAVHLRRRARRKRPVRLPRPRRRPPPEQQLRAADLPAGLRRAAPASQRQPRQAGDRGRHGMAGNTGRGVAASRARKAVRSPVRPGHPAADQHRGHRALPILRARGQAAARREDRRPQQRARSLPGQRRAARRRRAAGLLAAGQGRADAARPAARPQDVDGRGRHPRDPGRAAARTPGPGNARPVRPRLAADARETDRGSPGPVGGVPPAARRHRPALPGPAARQLAGAVPGRARRSPRSSATIGVLKEQRRVLRSQFRRLDYLAGCVLRSHTWRLLLRMAVLRDSDGAAHRDPALRRPLRISAPVRLH